MGLFDNPLEKLAKIGLAPVTGGLSLLAPDDVTAKIPVVRELTGARTDAEKELVKRQKAMAEDVRKRQRLNERARMNALGQKMLAFNPQNQMMAQMFGPEAAFSPQQMGAMAADPMARSRGEYDAAHQQAMMAGPIDPKTRQRTGGPMQGWTADDLQRMEEDERRRAGVEAAFSPVGSGPAPLQKTRPMAARKF